MKWKQWGRLVITSIAIAVTVGWIVGIPLHAPLNENLANPFLATMAQVLAGILAIVFSVSVLAVEITSDRYTPRLFSFFIGNQATRLTFLSLLVCILISVIAIGVQSQPMPQWGFLAMTWLFVFCLLTLPYYFQQTLRLLDPRNLAEQIRNEGLQALKKRDRQGVLDAVTSLGDVAVKAFERGEDGITRKYLDALQEIQQALIAPDSMLLPTEDKDIAWALLGFGISSPVANQYYRIFKVAIAKKNEELTLHIASLLAQTTTTLIDQGSSREILKGILQQYQEFIKIAIEHRDISRFRLVLSLREAIFRRAHKVFSEEHLSACLSTLEQVNRAIIDDQDSELWKKELGYFSHISSVEDLYDSFHPGLRKLLSDFTRAGISISRDEWAKWETLALRIDTRITPANKYVFELGMSEIERLIPASEQQLQEQARSTRAALQTLWTTTGVYDTFFTICVYAFYRKEFGYIKELWRHVNPPDAGASWANANLIHLNIGFLTYQMFYSSFVNWPIEGYHGGEMYVLQYYLLCLAYALQQRNRDWHPAVPAFTKALLSQDDEYSVAIGEELRSAYRFLINLPSYADKVLAQYEDVDRVIAGWDDVFNGQARDALEKARDWLADTERRRKWMGKAEGIIKKLPLDSSRVKAYREEALEYYQSQSQVGQLALTENSREKAPTELRGSCRIQCPEKRDFTLIGLGEPQEVGMRVGFEAVHQIVRAETAHIAKTIFEHEATKPIKVKQLTFDKVAEAAKKISEAGYQAKVLLAPGQQISSSWRDDPDFRTHMEHEGNERYLILDESTRLRILELDSDYAFILDRNAGNWATMTPLEIEVTGCDKKPLAVQITAQEAVGYQVLNPEAVEVLKFG